MSCYQQTEVMQIEIAHPKHDLPLMVDDFTLALRLGIRCRTFWWLLKTKKERYRVFHIPKRNGESRLIHDPCNVLKWVQRQLLVHLQQIPTLPCVGAYVKGRRCADSAVQHVGKQIRIGMDLKDFFPSHSRAMVRAYFHKALGYSYYVSSLLADLCTVTDGKRHFLPQGAPLSPTLCNLIAQDRLDRHLLAYLTPRGWTYTRYSDDLSFSHPDKMSKAEVNRVIAAVAERVKRAGYVVNWKKLKVQRAHHQQRMLGIVVNQKVSMPRSEYRRFRAILTNCIHQGFEQNALRYDATSPESFISHLQGKLSYFASIDPVKGAALKTLFEKAHAQVGDTTSVAK